MSGKFLVQIGFLCMSYVKIKKQSLNGVALSISIILWLCQLGLGNITIIS